MSCQKNIQKIQEPPWSHNFQVKIKSHSRLYFQGGCSVINNTECRLCDTAGSGIRPYTLVKPNGLVTEERIFFLWKEEKKLLLVEGYRGSQGRRGQLALDGDS